MTQNEQTAIPQELTVREGANLPANLSANGMAAVARESAMVQAQREQAVRIPRDMETVARDVEALCRVVPFAADAHYELPRGGNKIVGPSVQLARGIAQTMGNIAFGFRVLSESSDAIHIIGFAMDLERNSTGSVEDSFKPLIPRKMGNKTIWRQPNDAELRELIARRGALAERAALWKILPPGLVVQARYLCEETLQSNAQKMRTDFGERKREGMNVGQRLNAQGVADWMVEKQLEAPVSDLSPEQIKWLWSVVVALEEGSSQVDDYFDTRQDQGQQAPSQDGPADSMDGALDRSQTR